MSLAKLISMGIKAASAGAKPSNQGRLFEGVKNTATEFSRTYKTGAKAGVTEQVTRAAAETPNLPEAMHKLHGTLTQLEGSVKKLTEARRAALAVKPAAAPRGRAKPSLDTARSRFAESGGMAAMKPPATTSGKATKTPATITADKQAAKRAPKISATEARVARGQTARAKAAIADIKMHSDAAGQAAVAERLLNNPMLAKKPFNKDEKFAIAHAMGLGKRQIPTNASGATIDRQLASHIAYNKPRATTAPARPYDPGEGTITGSSFGDLALIGGISAWLSS